MTQVDINTKYSETMGAIRHYSNLRFAMLTIFVAITGGLLSVLVGDIYPEIIEQYEFDIIRLAGAWVSISFLIFEVALNIYLEKLWKVVDSLPGGSSSDVYRKNVKLLVRLAAGSIPCAVGVFWVFLPLFQK